MPTILNRTRTDDTSATVAAAEREQVDALAASVEHWTDEAADLERKLAALDADAGRRVLDEEATADDLAAERRDLDGRLRTSLAARDEAQSRLENARKATLLAIADDLDLQADREQTKLDEHQAKIDRLLEQLLALDHWTYRPHTLKERIHDVHGHSTLDGLVDVYGKPVEGSVRDQLAAPVQRLREKAAAIRTRAVDGMNDDTYVDALRFVDNRLAELEPTAA